MRRTIEKSVINDLETRIVLLSGPRQVGKTTLSKMLFKRFDYFNHDFAEHRISLKEKSWDRSADLLVLDELHKMKNWKTWIKGVFDVEGSRPRLLVTGSASMNVARKVGDSMAGRFFEHRLHPFDLKEMKGQMESNEAFKTLMRVGGFPEPFLKGSESFYKRWRISHTDIILRQDLIALEAVRDIQAIETLVELLKTRVGSPLSMSSLARDLERDSKTVKRWLSMLENLYVIFQVAPYHRNVARSLLKEPKIYFYDLGLVPDYGARLENLVACALKKEIDRIADEQGEQTRLHYLRTKDNRELDFAVFIDGRISSLIEVKSSDDALNPAFKHFAKFLPNAKKTQLVLNLKREKTFPDGCEIRSLVPWLSALELH